MRLRRGDDGDAEALARILGDAFAEMTYLPQLHTREEDLAFLRGVVLAEQEVWVAEEGGRAVGFCALSPGQLHHIYVAPKARGSGIGKALLDRAKERLPAGFFLWTFQANEGARRFYEREGLVAVELTDGAGNEERMPDVRYEWRG